jgi:hypothetical protein
VTGRNRCWNCEEESCSMNRCKQVIDKERCERNRLKWLEARDNARKNGGGGTKSPRGKFPEWRPPDPSENNKRIIYGIPYTWDGRKSWIADKTPASGLSETPPGALNNSSGDAAIPTQVAPPPPSGGGDDGTVMTSETGFTAEEKNELRRIEANIQNMGTNLSGFGAFISNLNNKH